MPQVFDIGSASIVPPTKEQYSGRLLVSSCDISEMIITGYDESSHYVSFDSMTLEELSRVYNTLYGASVVGFLRENRNRLKKWTGKSGFDFVKNRACNSAFGE